MDSITFPFSLSFVDFGLKSMAPSYPFGLFTYNLLSVSSRIFDLKYVGSTLQYSKLAEEISALRS